MSVDIYVEAHRRVSEDDMKYLVIYNDLVSIGLSPPTEVISYLRKVLGDGHLFPDEEITIPADGMVAIDIRGEGDARYGEGMIIKIADLPPGTEALRIYME